eukprot:7574304-Lingulodinium_polyedra.AAC.1
MSQNQLRPVGLHEGVPDLRIVVRARRTAQMCTTSGGDSVAVNYIASMARNGLQASCTPYRPDVHEG